MMGIHAIKKIAINFETLDCLANGHKDTLKELKWLFPMKYYTVRAISIQHYFIPILPLCIDNNIFKIILDYKY